MPKSDSARTHFLLIFFYFQNGIHKQPSEEEKNVNLDEYAHNKCMVCACTIFLNFFKWINPNIFLNVWRKKKKNIDKKHPWTPLALNWRYDHSTLQLHYWWFSCIIMTIPFCIKGTEKSTETILPELMVKSATAMSADPFFTISELIIKVT